MERIGIARFLMSKLRKKIERKIKCSYGLDEVRGGSEEYSEIRIKGHLLKGQFRL